MAMSFVRPLPKEQHVSIDSAVRDLRGWRIELACASTLSLRDPAHREQHRTRGLEDPRRPRLTSQPHDLHPKSTNLNETVSATTGPAPVQMKPQIS
jgi:hypothetical protein